jgi:hypothetical protein
MTTLSYTTLWDTTCATASRLQSSLKLPVAVVASSPQN